jgi:hypothetical protein
MKSRFSEEQFKKIDKEKIYNKREIVLNLMGIKKTAANIPDW